MKPQPWSHSALDTFRNCPRRFYEQRVAKSVVEEKGEATLYGEWVHEQFEARLRDGVVLPAELETHEPFMARIDALPGTKLVEQKIALNRKLQPCGFFDADVWYRGVIDAGAVDGSVAVLVDHKTGKHHSKYGQLKLFALWAFATYPLEKVRVDYYWTQLKATNGVTLTRDQVPALWGEFMPDLKQYAEAFRTDTWTPRPSGLCKGWCPVKDCEHWEPRRQKW